MFIQFGCYYVSWHWMSGTVYGCGKSDIVLFVYLFMLWFKMKIGSLQFFNVWFGICVASCKWANFCAYAAFLVYIQLRHKYEQFLGYLRNQLVMWPVVQDCNYLALNVQHAP